MKHPVGQPRDERKDYWAERLGLTPGQRKHLYQPMIELLERCADDDARRCLFLPIMGKSRTYPRTLKKLDIPPRRTKAEMMRAARKERKYSGQCAYCSNPSTKRRCEHCAAIKRAYDNARKAQRQERPEKQQRIERMMQLAARAGRAA